MINRTRIALVAALMLAQASIASAQDGRLLLRLNNKPGQQDRYAITAVVDTEVSPNGSGGIANRVRKELTATITLRTAAGDGEGRLVQEAIIEELSLRATVNGSELPSAHQGLAGKRIEMTLDNSGQVLKCSIPQEVARAGLADIVLSLGGWLPRGEVGPGETWQPGDRGFLYAPSLADIPKSPSVLYKLSSAGATALIEGSVELEQSGAALLTTDGGPLDVNVIARGSGATRFRYEVESSRIIEASTETRLEGRLANVTPGPKGESRRREGSVVEKSTITVKLVE